MNPDDYDDDEQTSITDTQPISKIINGARKKIEEFDELCQETTIRINALELGTAAGVERSKQT